MRDAWREREQIMANLQAALTLANELQMVTLACCATLDDEQKARLTTAGPRHGVGARGAAATERKPAN